MMGCGGSFGGSQQRLLSNAEVTESKLRRLLLGAGRKVLLPVLRGDTPFLHSLHQEAREVMAPKRNPRSQGDRRDQFWQLIVESVGGGGSRPIWPVPSPMPDPAEVVGNRAGGGTAGVPWELGKVVVPTGVGHCPPDAKLWAQAGCSGPSHAVVSPTGTPHQAKLRSP
jgi:hypothetical protein